jgi:perosamine synthetase
MMPYPLSRPDISDEDVKAVVDVLKSPNLALGPRLDEFESAFAEYVGTTYAVGVNSGTSALHLAVRALDITDGDEVITTPFSFVASANCALYERAEVKFVDIDPVTLNMDPSGIEAAVTKKTKAILVVHVFGQPCDMEAVERVADAHDLAVIEDACEAIGATSNGQKVGSFGDVATFAFYPNKQMTTGEGGMLVTDDAQIAEIARSLRNQGRTRRGSWLEHDRLGYNYRLDEMSAALGLSQLRRIDEILAKRAQVAAWYKEALAEVEGVEPLAEIDGSVRSWFVYVVLLDKGHTRSDVMELLENWGVDCRAYFPPIHLQPLYRGRFSYKLDDFPVTEDVAARTLALPFYNSLTKNDVEMIVEQLARSIK